MKQATTKRAKLRQFAWFLAIWAGSVGVLGMIAFLIRLALGL